MKRWIGVALLTLATLTNAQTTPAKKELVAKLLQLQQPGIENVARGLVEQVAGRMMQDAGRVLQTQVPPEKREAIGKNIEASVRKYIDESTPLLRERAVKLAPSIIGAALEEKFTEDELKQLIAWNESPVNKKYQQALPEMQSGFLQKLVAEGRPVIEPKVQALEQSIRSALSSGVAASPVSKPASAAKPADKPASK